MSDRAISCPKCGHPITYGIGLTYARGEPISEKSKYTAAALALFFGTIGGQRFYLGQWRSGIACILFAWTLIPTIMGFADAIRYGRMSEQQFMTTLIERDLLKTPEPGSASGAIHTDLRLSVENGRVTWEQVYDTLSKAQVHPREIASFMSGGPLHSVSGEAMLHELISSGRVPSGAL